MLSAVLMAWLLMDCLQILERVFVPLEERPSIDEVAMMIGVPVFREAALAAHAADAYTVDSALS